MSRHGQNNYIRRPDVVERIGSYLGTSFPLFHDCKAESPHLPVLLPLGPELAGADVVLGLGVREIPRHHHRRGPHVSPQLPH